MRIIRNELTLRGQHQIRPAAGFTLIEFMVAMALFLVISGTTFAMFAKNAPNFTQQQNTAALNIGLQNVVSQMQIDLVNAGTGYYPGMLLPAWPTGVTIMNQPYTTTACNNATTFTYSATCFDKLNILAINPNTPPTHPTDTTGLAGASNCSATAGNTLPAPGTAMAWHSAQKFYIQAAPGLTLAQTAAGYSVGDQLILIQSTAGTGNLNGSTSGGTTNTTLGANIASINTLVITGTPIVTANYVALPFNAGNPTAGPGNIPPPGMNTSADDPLDISTSSTAGNLGYGFCASAWVMKLDPITYWVDVSNAQDPTLKRNHVVNGTLNTDTIAEQIIGFKVGAAVWGNTDDGDPSSTALYNFYAQNTATASPVGYNSNYSLIRSVRVTLIGRTSPNIADPFRNTFDSGPYQVLGADVVINPRNMTMN